MILSSADLDTTLHQILLIVRNYFGIPNCAVFLVSPSGNELFCRAHYGYDEDVARRRRIHIPDEGVTGWVAGNRAPLYVPDVRKEPRYLEGHPAVKSELALPLVVRDEIVGVLDIESDKLDYFTDDMIGLLALFAGQAAVALENARLYSTERRRMRQIELINLIARSATSASDIDQFLSMLADLIYDTFEGTDVCILLREPDGKLALRAHAGRQLPNDEVLEASERTGIIGDALTARGNVVQNDIFNKPGWPALLAPSGSELCAPLVSFGETLGVIAVIHHQPHFFSADDRSIAQAAADVCATAIKNVQLTEELRRVTNTDSLTGAYNQRYFHSALAQEVSRSKRYHKSFSVLLLDIANFRYVNASMGFDGGDHVLREVAQGLRTQLRRTDIVCRYAGDRFALILPEGGEETMGSVKQKVDEQLAKIQFTFDGGTRCLKAAYAGVVYPDDGSTELELVRILLARIGEAKKNAAAAGA